MTDYRPHSWHPQPDNVNLAPDSYTYQKLQHATPEHLHLTSRRFFIGPIPEGWLKTHRRDWYKKHLHINYSSRTASFSSDSREARTRRLSGLEGPSASALFQHSFPQPEELSEEEEGEQNGAIPDASNAASASTDTPPALRIPRGSEQKAGIAKSDDDTDFVDAPSEPSDVDDDQEDGPASQAASQQKRREASGKSVATISRARDPGTDAPFERTQGEGLEKASGLQVPRGSGQKTMSTQQSSTVANCNDRPSGSIAGGLSINSTSPLLRDADESKASSDAHPKSPSKGIMARVKRRSQMGLSDAGSPIDQAGKTISRTTSNLRNLVKFDIPEDSKRAELQLKAKAAQMTIQRASTRLRRQKLQDGLVVKMERMLVRVDFASKDVPEDFDENGNQKIDSRVKDKWREYMIVCRHSTSDNADFVLQMYKTRVIQEIEQKNGGNKAQFEIPLGRKISKVNLYSSLDKSVVVWTPVSRGTLIFIMQARTASNAVEWYTFLRNLMGWRRASELQINIPDLSVSLRLTDPFKNLETSQAEAEEETEDTETVILKTMKEEQAVAESLIRRCLDQLEDSPEWADVLDSWSRNQRIGLVWKRYDRLEWVHGANERKMYGTIAMAKSHELELRPKSHYSTTTVTRKKHKTITEPVPVEGFLIRLTGQRGRAKRLGLMYHKQLYFSTHDHFLVFSRPPKSIPPPPPKLPAGQNGRIPSAGAISKKTPDTWTVNPYPLENDRIKWLLEGHAGTPETRRLHDRDALDEDERKAQNLLNCDGYINLVDILKVRKAKRGATPADDDIESGSDVDFNEEVEDTARDDGATHDFDDDRTFELVMRNGLIIRLQAADMSRRKEWIQHLRALAKYWRNRTVADITLYKSTRNQNLSTLHIDEEAEAYLGQFARKWEVTQSYASSQLYNLCGIARCRTIHMSGMLYRKPRIHAPFTRCSVILAAGTLLIFQDVLRAGTGKQLAHIHHERMANLDLKDCYIYSGLLTESDLLYQNQTFDANKPGHHALPRIYLEDGWTSTDEDVMTTFVVWHGKSKSWFRAEEGAGGGEKHAKEGKRRKLKRVAKLGSKGRSIVFRARSRAERDHWVLAIQNEIERCQIDAGLDFRIEEARIGTPGSRETNGSAAVNAASGGVE